MATLLRRVIDRAPAMARPLTLVKGGRDSGGAWPPSVWSWDDLVRVRTQRTGERAPREPMVYLHMPKTAGQTFKRIIARNYHPPRTNHIGRNSNPQIHALVTDDTWREVPGVVTGHMDFGGEIYRNLGKKFINLTHLRQPIDRVVSHYYFILKTPRHRRYEEMTRNKTTLRDFVAAHDVPETINGQTARLLGRPMPVWERVGYHKEIVDEVKRNIETCFSFVGLTERFDESLLLIGFALDWPDMFYVRQNVNPKRKAMSAVDPEVVKVIEEHNRMDLEVYRFAAELLERRIAALDGFEEKLSAFREANAAHGDLVERLAGRKLHPREA